MARYVMVLRRARSITRGIARGGPWKSSLFWTLKWLRANIYKYLKNTIIMVSLARVYSNTCLLEDIICHEKGRKTKREEREVINIAVLRAGGGGGGLTIIGFYELKLRRTRLFKKARF
jgi:hypothetical protein